jgi:hypothetical protein
VYSTTDENGYTGVLIMRYDHHSCIREIGSILPSPTKVLVPCSHQEEKLSLKHLVSHPIRLTSLMVKGTAINLYKNAVSLFLFVYLQLFVFNTHLIWEGSP